ncbi:50S ribosomal protein L9 [Buchnera aphidicola (Aphis helianthi)]|uniref:Large ribosomal subunit protein bL9 n=1 Tax=Buchnera aphidicola (Aphis helianthi) TaxID=2315802 RepID=A0A4D6XKF1_9GAMM|nr:50S ribosomal protein L9 [Buchnera aphidicola]QCI17356.1 50S ribosomal protein L9 [Buchnera aphidicola (Aphis helianthi)]
MEVILLLKVNKLGDSGKIVKVKSGYARNYLIPQGKAILANQKNIESFKAQQVKLKEENISKLLIAKSRAEKLKQVKFITIPSKVGKENKIFGSVGIRDIIKELSKIGIKINKKEIKLPNGVLRHIGEHQVIFQPHSEIIEYFIVNVIEKK